MTFVSTCALDDLAVGSASRLVVEGVAMAVVRTDDAVYAIDDRCSHADVSLAQGEVEGCTLECWLHGSAFDLRTGAPLSPPASQPVPTYAVRLEGSGPDAIVLIDPTPITVSEDSK